jgi:hypothetical protein
MSSVSRGITAITRLTAAGKPMRNGRWPSTIAISPGSSENASPSWLIRLCPRRCRLMR